METTVSNTPLWVSHQTCLPNPKVTSHHALGAPWFVNQTSNQKHQDTIPKHNSAPHFWKGKAHNTYMCHTDYGTCEPDWSSGDLAVLSSKSPMVIQTILPHSGVPYCQFCLSQRCNISLNFNVVFSTVVFTSSSRSSASSPSETTISHVRGPSTIVILMLLHFHAAQVSHEVHDLRNLSSDTLPKHPSQTCGGAPSGAAS